MKGGGGVRFLYSFGGRGVMFCVVSSSFFFFWGGGRKFHACCFMDDGLVLGNVSKRKLLYTQNFQSSALHKGNNDLLL